MLSGSSFVLRIPVDASRVPEFTPDRLVKVLVWNQHGCIQHQVVTFSPERKGMAVFTFDRAPESLRVALGPETATVAELQHLQTVSTSVPASRWAGSTEVEIPSIRVSSYDWWWWQHWRQRFRVTGRLVNRQGRPVHGATVSAFDVDAWWWWTAQEQVGSAVTERDGSFLIEFTRCCGWWPWWWWATRDWQVDAGLVDRITGFVHQYPGLRLLAATAHGSPNLDIFEPLLASTMRRVPPSLAALSRCGTMIDPVGLEHVRERLVEILPRRFPLPVWPWSEWSPWEDCGANLIFRATEAWGERTAVLLQEAVTDARWDIPAALDVRLTAREETYSRVGRDWTLVDYLFPHAAAERRGAAGVVSRLQGGAAERRPEL